MVEGGMHGRGVCMVGGMYGRGVHGRGQGACIARGVHGRGGGMHGREACMAGEMATGVDVMHPTGIHSCFNMC